MLAVVIVGIGLAYTTFIIFLKKPRRTPLLYLSIAFALITAGTASEFLLLDLGYSLTFSQTIESVITAVGLATVLYAIRSTR